MEEGKRHSREKKKHEQRHRGMKEPGIFGQITSRRQYQREERRLNRQTG